MRMGLDRQTLASLGKDTGILRSVSQRFYARGCIVLERSNLPIAHVEPFSLWMSFIFVHLVESEMKCPVRILPLLRQKKDKHKKNQK